ncbi:MAG: DUF2089 domain-containing protein [Candidatus Cloacimonetes bacterium]|nr:DUF2089 domain-containing protein [Candidatus Cloacimonadota bacterium]
MFKRLRSCPVCNSKLEVTRYHCPECDITIEGKFTISEFSALTGEQQEFVRTFICCQGNIKEVEKVLGISYPTVKNRLNQVGEVLCHSNRKSVRGINSEEVLSALESGDISVSEAIKKLEGERR